MFTGSLIVNPNTRCSDTAYIDIGIYPEIRADFSFDYDTCVAGDVIFTDLSETDAEQLTAWDWSFDDGISSTSTDPSHRYLIPGDFDVSLTVTDNNNCKDSKTQRVKYFPVPPLIVVQPDRFIGCQPGTIKFTNLSTPIDESYDIRWSFGDGGTGDEISPVYTYEDNGVYSVAVELTSPIGCYTQANFPDWITIQDGPEADFIFSPTEVNQFNSEVSFTDLSMDAKETSWFVDRIGRITGENPTISFPDTGVYTVALVAVHENGCTDTAFAEVDVVPVSLLKMPNAFTPNGDGTNDIFIGSGLLEYLTGYSLSIWSRWGDLVFQTDDPLQGWNGRQNNIGDLLPTGVYVYQVEFVGSRGDVTKLEGFATLLK